MPKINRGPDGDSTPRRASGSAQQQADLAAGRIPMGGPVGGSGDPLRVQIMSGGTDFFESLKDALGLRTAGGAAAGVGKNQFQAVITSQAALAQVTKELTNEVKIAVAMMKQNQVAAANLNQQSTAANQAQMNQLLSVLQQNGGGGGGHGSGGHGGGGHGGATYNPQTGQFSSYGSTGSRIRAGAANLIQGKLGTGSLPDGASAEQQAKAAGFSRIASGLASGGFGAAASRIPYVGTAISIGEDINKGATWLTNERAQNAKYQSVLGGQNSSMDNRGNPVSSAGGLIGDMGQFFSGGSSTSTSGLGNRMAEEGYVMGQRFSSGGMDEASSRALFQGVTSLGYTGDRRGGALQFAGDNYKTMGMDQSESMNIIALSAKYAQSSLQGLSQELQNVTKAAVQTGQSAQAVRAAFTQNLGSAYQASAGTGAGALATAATDMTAAGGRTLAAANPLSVMNDQSSKYQMASAMGMTPSQLEAAGQTNPGITMQALGKRSDMYMRSLGSGTLKNISDLITKSGGSQKVAADQGLQAGVATDLMRSQGYDITVARNVVSSIDPSMANESDQAIAQYLINYQSGNNPTNQGAALTQQMSPKPITQAERDSKKGNTSSGSNGVGMGNFAASQNQKGNQMMSDAGAISNLFNGDQTKQGYTLEVNSQYYDDMTKKSGKSDPVIEKLISQYGTDPDIRFKVKTKDGDKAVTFGEAIRNFSDQLSSGSASIVSSNKDINNRTVKDLAGSTGAKVTSDSQSWSGSDFATVQKEVGADGGAADPSANTGGGQVTLSLSAEAQRLFNVQTTGNVSLDNSAAAGRPAAQSTGPK